MNILASTYCQSSMMMMSCGARCMAVTIFAASAQTKIFPPSPLVRTSFHPFERKEGLAYWLNQQALSRLQVAQEAVLPLPDSPSTSVP